MSKCIKYMLAKSCIFKKYFTYILYIYLHDAKIYFHGQKLYMLHIYFIPMGDMLAPDIS